MAYKYTMASAKPTGSKPMSESEFLVSFECMETIMDSIDAGNFDNLATKVVNISRIRDLIKNDPKLAKSVVEKDPELSAMYDGSLKTLDNVLANELNLAKTSVAKEGFGKDFWWDGLIEAILNRNKHTVEYLVPTIKECLSKVKQTEESMFGQWRAFKQLAIFAKYLPDQKDWSKCVTALTNGANYLKSIKPEKFDSDKFAKFFTGTPYRRHDGEKINTSTTNPGTDWSPILFLFTLVPCYTEDIRVRGWTERKHFIGALNDALKMCKLMNELAATANKAKANGNDKLCKEYMNWIKEEIDLMGHLGRGITTASKKIGGSIWARLFPTFNGEIT